MKKIGDKSIKTFGLRAAVLLITAVMILPTFTALADTDKTYKLMSEIKYVSEEEIYTQTSRLDTILEEGFEDGVNPPPGGWYTDELNHLWPWVIVHKAMYPDFVHSGFYAGWINYDIYNPSDNWLISPDLDLTGYDTVTLVFWAESNTLWPGATMELHIRGDGFDDTIWDMINDEDWYEVIYREMTFDLSPYVDQVINIAWRYVGIDGQSFALDDISVFGCESVDPDLDCDGSLSWVDITPGHTVPGEFTVKNIGESTSELDWEIESYPEWGSWTFTPASGEGLTPEDDPVIVEVEVIAPDESETEFDGEIKIVNSEDLDDFCIIDVSLATPQNNQHSIFSKVNQFLNNLVERFPLLERILEHCLMLDLS